MSCMAAPAMAALTVLREHICAKHCIIQGIKPESSALDSAHKLASLHKPIVLWRLLLLLVTSVLACTGCIQLAWRAWLLSPSRAVRMQAVVMLQAAVRGHAARHLVAQLRQRAAASNAMKAALASGSRSQVKSAALQLSTAGQETCFVLTDRMTLHEMKISTCCKAMSACA